MRKSLLHNIIALKKQFQSISEDNYAAINDIFGGDLIDSQYSIGLQNGHVLNIDWTNSSISYTDEHGTIIQDLTDEQLSGLVTDPVGTIQSIVINDQSLSSLLSEGAVAGQRYESLAKISDLFLTNSKVETAVIINVVDDLQIPGLDSGDLKATLISMDRDGYITQYAWLSIIQGWFSEAKATLDSGSFEMDTSSVFYISNLLSNVLEGIVEVVGTICSMLLTLLGGIFAVIGVVMGLLINAFSKVFNTAVSTKPTCSDPNSSINYIKGPIIKNWYPGFSSDMESSTAWCYTCGGMDLYVFNDKASGKLGFNGFLNLDLDCDAAISQWLTNHRVTGSNTITIETIDGQEPAIYSGILSESDQINIRTLSGDDLSKQIIKTVACYGLSLISDSSISKFRLGAVTPASAVSFIYRDGFDSKFYPVRIACCLLGYLQNGATLDNFANDFLSYNGIDSITQWMIHASEGIFKDESGDQVSHLNTEYSYAIESSDLDTRMYFKDLPISKDIGFTSRWLFPEYAYGLDIVDVLPTDRAFSMNNTTIDAIVLASSVVALATVGLVVAGTLTRKAINKHKFKTRLQSTNSLNDAKAAYLQDPSKENFESYYKQVKSYNFKSKIFGWPEYDAVNSWYNYAETPSSDGFLSIQRLIKA